MSTTASAATETAVRASISTPVRSTARTVAAIDTPSSVTARSTSTPWTPITCASGSSSGVRFAAAMPATLATARTSPLGTSPPRRAATTDGGHRTRPSAVALRAVTCLPLTSTIRACPAASRWVNSRP